MVKSSTGGAKKLTVLIIDNDEFLVRTYQTKLQREGFEVRVVLDSVEVTSLINREPPALVLLSLELKGMSSLEILKSIKNNDNWKTVPMIVISNILESETLTEAENLGVVDKIVLTSDKVQDVIIKVKKYAKSL
ncbi:response regulator [Candidatus Jorgensenbacteria bacterium]|nr:response regulator [Candidatus Jorgensenbacteria bacterium]